MLHRNRSAVWLFLSAVLFAPKAVLAEETSAPRPNILVIVADDLGWADVGYHGSPIPTPNIDRLVREGVELDQHYVAPVCTPTRAALLSGRYWSRFGITTPSNNQVFRFGTLTIASALREVGYQTCISGKWHLGSRLEGGPEHLGFSQSYGSLAGGTGPWDHRYKRGPFSHTWHRNGKLLEEQGHITDLLTTDAIRFIREAKQGPFFLYVPFTAVHHPLDEPKEWLEAARKADPKRPQYSAATMHMDHCIGEIVRTLEETGQREKTVIVFFSDNGGTIEPNEDDVARYPGEYPSGQWLGRNEPLRGKKSQLYEGGIRTPALVNWKGTLRPRKIDVPLHVIDWAPTFCKIADFRPAADPMFDGQDIWPILTGKTTEISRHLYWLGPRKRSAALRLGDWKLVVHYSPNTTEVRTELFDLANDPQEKSNLASQKPEIVEKLMTMLNKERQADDDAVVEVSQ